MDNKVGSCSFFFISLRAKTVENSHRSFGCPLPGSVQGQVEWGFEQPDLVKDVAAYGSVCGLGDL